MANKSKRISELPALSPASLDTTYVLGISGSTTYKISINQLTSSLDTTFATDLVTNALSSSLDGKLSTSSFNSYTASAINGTISGSSQLTSSFDQRYVVSGSITQTTWDNIASKPVGIISGSSQLTSSYDTRYSLSGSILSSFSQSVDSRLDSLEAEISSSIEYINGNFEGYSGLTPISGTFYKPTIISANNNIEYNSGSGLFKLNAGKTYILEAYIPHGYYGLNNSISFQWKDTTNNIHIGTGASPRLSGTWDGGLDIAKAIINTTQLTYVGVISTLNSPTQPNAYIVTGQSYIIIQEIGVGISNEVVVSGSIDFTQITNKPTLISGSSQLTSSYDTRYTLSGSVQPLPSNLLSSSAQITSLGFISSSAAIPAGTISGSSQLTSSYDIRYTLSGSVVNVNTSSLTTSISNLNLFTQSAGYSVGLFNNFTQSFQNYSASLNEIKDDGIFLGYSTRFNFRGNTLSASVTPNVSGLITNIDMLPDTTKLDTSSFNQYTASISTASLVTSISNLNSFTSSQSTIFNSLNSFTQSAGYSVQLLNSFTQSFQNYSASLNEIKDDGIFLGYSTRFNFRGSLISASVVPNVSGLITNIDIQLPSGIVSGSSQVFGGSGVVSGSYETTGRGIISSSVNLVTTSSFNSYTASISTASLVTSISNLNTFTASVTTASIVTSISNLNTFTASVSTASLVTSITNLNTFTASVSTASLVTSITNLNTFTASVSTASLVTSITNLNTTTASLNTSVSSLNTFTASQSTASLVTSISNLNTTTASLNISVNALNTATSSYETKGRGIWSGSAQLPSGIVSGSSQTIANLPTGTVSGSSQVLGGSGVWSGSAQLPTGVVSGSAQTILNLPTGVVSGSAQTILNLPTGVVSGSAQTILNLPTGTISGSSQLTSSYDGRYIQTGSFNTYTSSFSSSLASSITSVSGTFTNLSINGQPTTYGVVSPDYINAGRITSDQTGAGAGSDIIFNYAPVSSGISLNTSTGVFTLTAGKTYQLFAELSFSNFSDTANGYEIYDWVDATTNTRLATTGIGAGIGENINRNTNEFNATSTTLIYTPTTNQTIKVRIVEATGTVTVRAGIGTKAIIQQINPTISVQANATGTVNNQYSGVTLTSNQVIGSPGTPTNIVFQSATGTVPYNTSTGVWTLTSGVTYNLTAVLAITGSSNYLGYQWVDSVSGTALSTTLGFATLATTQVSSVPLSIVYTPNTNQTIALRNVNGQWASVIANYSWATVTQINQAFALNTLNTMQISGSLITTGSITSLGGITGSIAATNGVISGSSQLTTTFPSKTTGAWSVPAGASTQSFSVESGASYTMWVNGNIPNGIITWNATVTTSNTNVPVVGSQYGWYYTTGNTLVLTTMPDQIIGTNGSIATTPTSYAPNTSNVFKFGITNNSGTTQTINYGYIKLS
jgi:hypothetical protein